MPWTREVGLFGGSRCLPFTQSDALHARVILRTPGHDFRVVFEGIVDDSSIVGIQRIRLDGPAGDANGF